MKLTFSLAGNNTEFLRWQSYFIKMVGFFDPGVGRKNNGNKPPSPPGQGPGGGDGGGGGGGGGNDLTPSFVAQLQNTLILTTAGGVATPSYSVSASTGFVVDWEAVYRRVLANEARFFGARRVQNLVSGHSQDFTNASWDKLNAGTGSAPTVTANFATDPLGGSTASRLQLNKGAGETVGDYSIVRQAPTILTAAKYVWTIYIKSNSGTPTIGIWVGNGAGGNSGALLTLGSSWVRYSVTTPTTSGTSGNFVVGLIGNALLGQMSSTADILVWGGQIELVQGQSNQNPAEYVSVGVTAAPYHGANVDAVKYFNTKVGNTVASNVVTETTGASITSSSGGSSLVTDAYGPFGLLLEKGQTNLSPFPEAFDSWTLKENCTITANTSAVNSPAGECTADAFFETAATGDHQLSVNPTLVAATYTYWGIFVKPLLRTDIFVRFDSASGNATTTFTLTGSGSAAAQTVTGSIVAGDNGITAYPGGWYLCWQRFTTGAGVVNQALRIYALSGGTTNYAGNAGTAAYYFWGSQIIQDRTSAEPRPTYNSGGTRGVDSLNYVFAGNASATVGTAYAETRTLWSGALGYTIPILSFGVATLYPLYSANNASTVINVNDGTTAVQKTGMSDMSTAFRKVASCWGDSTMLVLGEGANNAASGAFDGNMGSTAIGVGAPTTFSGNVWFGYIRNLKIFTTKATVGQLNQLTS